MTEEIKAKRDELRDIFLKKEIEGKICVLDHYEYQKALGFDAGFDAGFELGLEARQVCPACGEEVSHDQKIRVAHDVIKYELEIEKLKEASEKLLKALEFYGEFSNWYGEFKHRANKHFTDFSRSDLEQFDGHMIGGKRARQAIAEFKENNRL